MKNKLFIVCFILVIMLSFSWRELHAAAIDKTAITNYVNKLQNVMNRRSDIEIKNFFQYYTTQDSKYLLTNYYVNPDNITNIIAQEQHEMNKEQYINYIKSYLLESGFTKYYIQFTIDNIILNPEKNQAAVSLHYEENSVLGASSQSVNQIQEYQKTTANCNMLVQVETIDVVLVGLNCVRQSARKPVEEIQRQFK